MDKTDIRINFFGTNKIQRENTLPIRWREKFEQKIGKNWVRKARNGEI